MSYALRIPGVHFEADPGGGGGGGGEPAPAPAPAPTAVEPVPGGGEPVPAVEPPPAAPAPVWHDDPAFIDTIEARAAAMFEERMAPLVPLLERVFGDGGGGDEPGGAPALELNPWDDSFGTNLATIIAQASEQTLERMQQMMSGIAAPLAAREQAEVTARGEENLKDILADDIARNGDFATDPETGQAPGKSLIRPLADALFPEFAQKFGATPRAAEFAMAKAAGIVRELERVAGTAALTREQNRLATLAGTNGEPGASGNGGVQVRPATQSRSMGEALRGVTERHAAALRGGTQ
jgi:hypothetical protein